MPVILRVEPDLSQSQKVIQKAAAIIRAAGLVAFPTETFYALGALASDRKAVERVYQLKGRPREKPLSVLIGDQEELPLWVAAVPRAAERLMARFWPGPVTIVFPAASHLPENLTAGTGKLGIRLSSHPVARALVLAVGAPITATSANRSGAASCRSPAAVVEQLGAALEAVLDGGLTPGRKGSTIADVTIRPPKILRVGAVAAPEVLSCCQEGAEPE